MKILYMTDPTLRKVSEPVKHEELEYIKSLVPEMTELMNKENGLGLAANQVGVAKRFFIMKVNGVVKLFINPRVIAVDNLQLGQEGCLSIPGVSAQVERFQQVKVIYMDEDWIEQVADFSQMEAVAIQHEMDHLEGKLYIDMLKPLRRTMVMDKFRKYVKMNGR